LSSSEANRTAGTSLPVNDNHYGFVSILNVAMIRGGSADVVKNPLWQTALRSRWQSACCHLSTDTGMADQFVGMQP